MRRRLSPVDLYIDFIVLLKSTMLVIDHEIDHVGDPFVIPFLNLEVPRSRSEIGRSSFKHRAALAWNLLPHHAKECANLRSFKIHWAKL